VNELEIEERTQAALLPLLLFFLSVFFSSLLFLSTASTVAVSFLNQRGSQLPP
jgi:hypothetical protein